MVDNELQLMLKSIIGSKIAFNKFYRKGFYSYPKEDSFIGEVAIVNEKALASFLQDTTSKSNIVATVNFKDSGTSIYRVNGENSSFQQFGEDINNSNGFHTFKAYTPNRKRILEDISSIKTHCTEKKNSFQSKKTITQLLDRFNSQKKKLSRKEVYSLLNSTIDQLNKSINLDKKDSKREVSPKIYTESKIPNEDNINIDSINIDDNIR